MKEDRRRRLEEAYIESHSGHAYLIQAEGGDTVSVD